MQLLEETDIDWSYWCLDGYKCDDQEDETYGLLTHDFKSFRYPWMVDDLKKIGKPKPRGGIKRNQSLPKLKNVEKSIQNVRSSSQLKQKAER